MKPADTANTTTSTRASGRCGARRSKPVPQEITSATNSNESQGQMMYEVMMSITLDGDEVATMEVHTDGKNNYAFADGDRQLLADGAATLSALADSMKREGAH